LRYRSYEEANMAVPLLTKKVVKKRSAKFIRPQSDRRITVKVNPFSHLISQSFRILVDQSLGFVPLSFYW